jgi:hypothetical protein
MRRLILALSAAPVFLGAPALAQPTPLSDPQMDKVSAGFFERDISNTSFVEVSIFQRGYLTDPTPNTLSCTGCFLSIITPTFSIVAKFGPG